VNGLDLLVVGAGPGGIAAALRAHERGLRVLVVDKATFPRDKTCGDGLTAGALRLLEQMGVDIPAMASCASVAETVLVSPNGRQVSLPMPTDGQYSVVVPRLDLDAALVTHARGRGLKITEGCALTGLDDTPSGAHAELDDGTTVDASFIVAADGHWSTVRRLREPNAERDLGTWHAFRQYFRGVEDRRQWVLFERDLLPGYAWVFPLPDGRANVGFGVLRASGVSGKHLHQLWTDLLGRTRMRGVLGERAEPEDAHRAWPIPASFDPARLADGRVLYVGDAASVVDPMTGEGIAQALETGMLAADAIARGGHAVDIAHRYRDDVKHRLGRDLRFARALQRVLASPLGATAAIRTVALSDWTRRNFARWMFEDYPRAVLFTPSRWRRGMFSAPGAYAEAGRDA
jgi:geranylgeranyl reductase family protein